MVKYDDLGKLLYDLAQKAYEMGEIPVSAIVIHNGAVLSKSYNLRETDNDITAHAEILAIREAAKSLNRWNLSDCELYVSLKPCSMCEEVIKQSRIKKVYYLLDKLDYKKVFSGCIFEKVECSDITSSYQQLLSDFFQNKR